MYRGSTPKSLWGFKPLFVLVLVALTASSAFAQTGVLPTQPAESEPDEALQLSALEERSATLRERISEWERQATEYQSTWEQASVRDKVLDAEIAKLKNRDAIEVRKGLTASELDARVAEAEQELAAARREAMALDSEAALRAERRKKLPELLAAAKQKLAELEGTPIPTSGDPAVAEEAAKVARLEREVLEAEVRSHENELASYEARGRLLSKERDRAAMRITYFDALAAKLRDASKAQERAEVAEETEAAQKRIESIEETPEAFAESLREIARENEELATLWTGDEGLIDQIDDVSVKLARADGEVARLEAELSRLEARVEAVGLADSVGVLLRRHRAEAPDVGMYRRFIRMRKDRIGAVQLQQIRLREEREQLSDIDGLVAQAMAEVNEPLTDEQEAELESLFRQLFEARRKYMDALMSDYETYFQKLVDFDARQQELIDRTEALLQFIDERILWIPSGQALGAAFSEDWRTATNWLFSDKYREQLVRGVEDAASRWWFINLLVVLLAGLFFPASVRIRRRIGELGDVAKDPSCDRYAPTAKAVAWTFLLATWLPILLAYAGWRLGMSPVATHYTRAVAMALVGTAAAWMTLAVPRQTLRPNGVAVAHCEWNESGAHSLFRQLRWLLAVMVPATFVIAVFEAHGEDAGRESVGRLMFLVVVLAITFFNAFALRPNGALAEVLQRGLTRRPNTIRVLRVVSVLLPVGLGVAAVRGFYWTALQFGIRMHLTVAFVFLLVIVAQLFSRWSLIASRVVESDDESTPEPEDEGVQVSRLMIGTVGLVALFGALAIWADLLPATRILDQVELWNVTKPITVSELDPSGVEQLHTEDQLVPVTLTDLFRALLTALVAIALVQNVPALIEATLLRRLAPGERYAYSTIVKYAVAVAGVALTFDAIGIGWSSLQWLIAAIGLGLGFGLQEIFANFISGLIILFERPIRVGDTVTVGTTSGTVSKIRIRATWITGFDRKELVVPNKAFVTGELINWTLSDAVLRIDVPVGIAYGSDTKQAIEVLQRVAADDPRVLSHPRPQALFLGFADSSLSFELRVYIRHVSGVLPTRHSLHMAIDEAFREADIEISFPQRDLHLRSLPDNLPKLLGRE
ncbi:MAG: mechanosensitive ion channel domain-containing protein [Myxococcota bacterium]